MKFKVFVKTVYKGKEKISEGVQYIWVSMKDLDCKCPRLRVRRRYMIVAKDRDKGRRNGITIDNRSIVLRWSESFGRKLRKYQRYERKGAC